MKITYDKKVDALYLNFQPAKNRVRHTFKLKDFLMIDVGAKGKICGIEILNASSHVPVKNFSAKNGKKKQPLKVK